MLLLEVGRKEELPGGSLPRFPAGVSKSGCLVYERGILLGLWWCLRTGRVECEILLQIGAAKVALEAVSKLLEHWNGGLFGCIPLHRHPQLHRIPGSPLYLLSGVLLWGVLSEVPYATRT